MSGTAGLPSAGLPRRPFLRPLLGWALGAPMLAFSVTCVFLMAPFCGGARAFWIMAPRYIRFTAWTFGIRRRLLGWETLPEAIRTGCQPVIFIGNHASLFDPPLLISTLPCHAVFVAKRELARVPFLGWVIWIAGFIFIDRSHRSKALASLHAAAKRIHGGQSIITFPEGTRSLDGRLLPFKRGVFNLAAEAQVPLVPFAIQGGAAALPKGDWRVAGVDYVIRIGTPMPVPAGTEPEALRAAAMAAVGALMAD
ncbi:MAG: 1-acyl-sn-glycerol-3-phosphate acyltransferase [Holophagaceae bacterium]|nr:1-acyl-sn-glycerol-3-phosphate acyltransferase [Holophagaceae bacterium]